MKKIITMLLVLCLVSALFVGCAGDKDRAENNGRVTDDPNEDNLMDDASDAIDNAGDAASDVIEGATDAVDDILGGNDDSTSDSTDTRDTEADDSDSTDSTGSGRKSGGPVTYDRVG